MIYDLIHEVENGHIELEVSESELLDFGAWFRTVKEPLINQWQCPELKRYSKKKKLGNYVSNTFMFNAFDEKGYQLLLPYLDGEFLTGQCGKETIYFYRPRIYRWDEVLDINQTIIGFGDDLAYRHHGANNKCLNIPDFIDWKREHPDDWLDDKLFVAKFAYKPMIKEQFLFTLDFKDLTNSYLQIYTYATDKLKALVEEHKLTGFIFKEMDNVIYLDG